MKNISAKFHHDLILINQALGFSRGHPNKNNNKKKKKNKMSMSLVADLKIAILHRLTVWWSLEIDVNLWILWHWNHEPRTDRPWFNAVTTFPQFYYFVL